jgi:starch synthase
MAKKLKIVSVSSEIAPFSKSGGLGDVARSLPKALKRLDNEVVCITPLYEKVIDKEKHDLQLIFKNVEVRIDSNSTVKVNYWKGYLMKDLPVYFVENKKYFSQRKKLYGSSRENSRFLVFDVAVLKLISKLKLEANIIHCHDWQTGLIPYFLKNDFKRSKTLKKAKTVFTIHNLVFQMGRNWWEVPVEKKDYGRKALPNLDDPGMEYVNFAKRGILYADVINTVSEQYREEIMTKRFGQDLNRVLGNRSDKLFGIINGIDHTAYNPENDPGLYKNYNKYNWTRKKNNKIYLQEKFGLAVNESVPLICATSRVTFQKGFELILKILDHMMQMNIQFIILGAGDKNYIRQIKKKSKKYPKKMIIIPSHEKNQKYETQVYAGSDFFLLPSHHEPCGINQLIAMRYGCIPIVRKVGGLYDTVINYNPTNKTGTGFGFTNFNEFALFRAIVRAVETYGHKDDIEKIVTRIMEQSNSWEIPAKKYMKLFRRALRTNGKNSR